MTKLRPCDCKDIADTKKLEEQGIGIGETSIQVIPNSVILTMGHTTIKIPMRHFKVISEWYLQPQNLK